MRNKKRMAWDPRISGVPIRCRAAPRRLSCATHALKGIFRLHFAIHKEFRLSLGLVPDWAAFTPWSALAGGALIGLAAAVLLLGSGRIAGIAGLVGLPLRDLLHGQAGGWLARHRLRLLFVAGLLIAPWLWRLAAPLPPMRLDVGTPVLIVAGLLVGFGSRLGNGCTSGHGVCGLSRLSLRSLVNVLCFMGSGFVTVFVMRHLLGG
jgi:uncharacterized membrane protein YedE/YeeE